MDHPCHFSAKKRKPAWTDRILWKVKAPGVGPSPSGRESHRLQVTQHSYRSHMEYTVSDHKPVAAQFVLQVSPGLIHLSWHPQVQFSIPWPTRNPLYTCPQQYPFTVAEWEWVMISIFRGGN